MKTFPMFLKMEDRSVVIIGGGEQAAQKCRLMLKTEADIIVVADTLEPELDGLKRNGHINVVTQTAAHGVFETAALVFIATGCKGADAAWHGIAKSHGAVTNVVDYPDLCDAYTPSIVDRDPVVVAIGTEGTAPVLGRQIKSKIEKSLEPRLGQLASLAGSLRPSVAQNIAPSQRRGFWRWVFAEAPRQLFASGSERDAIAMIKSAIGKGHIPDTTPTFEVHHIVADPNDPDLISVRDVKHLQEADVIYFNNPSLDNVLEYARRDAERLVISSDISNIALYEMTEDARSNGKNVVVLRALEDRSNVIRLRRDVSAAT